MTPKVGDWVRYQDDDGRDIVSNVVRVDKYPRGSNFIYTAETGKFWLSDERILEIRPPLNPRA